jgi:hypothetical protein
MHPLLVGAEADIWGVTDKAGHSGQHLSKRTSQADDKPL